MTIDLNCDMGEIHELAANGTQGQLLDYVTSVNISCGAHAGDEQLIEETIKAAVAKGVKIGAHPGYPDPENFGRVRCAITIDQIRTQLKFFSSVAKRCGADVNHVKPHGALYNDAAKDRSVAVYLAKAIASWKPGALVYGLRGSMMLDVFPAYNLRTVSEAFCDRRYEADGTLRSRDLPGALIVDPGLAATQAVSLVKAGGVQSLCIHSDTPNAVRIAAAVRQALDEAGI